MKRLSVLTVILIACLTFSMIFSGCSKELTTQEGIEYFAQCTQAIENADTYYIRTVIVENASNSREYQLNVKGDQIHYTIVSNQASNTTYVHTYYSDNNKYVMNKVNGKDVWSTLPMTKETFLLDSAVAPYNKDVVIIKINAILAAMQAGTLVPKTITQGDYVTTYTFDDIGAEMAALLGGTAQVDGKYPLTVETIADRVSKIVDSDTSPKIKHYISYDGPNIIIPKVG